MLIDKRSLDILAVVDMHSPKVYLRGVHVRHDGSLEASNGRLVALVTPPIDAKDEQKNTLGGRILSAEDLASVAKTLKKHDQAQLEPSEVKKTGYVRATVHHHQPNVPNSYWVGTIDAKYPETDASIPSQKAAVRFTLEADLLKMLGALAEDGGQVTFEVTRAAMRYSSDHTVMEVAGAIRFTATATGDRPITGAVMPSIEG